jgi:hypothetical protein
MTGFFVAGIYAERYNVVRFAKDVLRERLPNIGIHIGDTVYTPRFKIFVPQKYTYCLVKYCIDSDNGNKQVIISSMTDIVFVPITKIPVNVRIFDTRGQPSRFLRGTTCPPYEEFNVKKRVSVTKTLKRSCSGTDILSISKTL